MKLSLCIATFNEENNIHYPLDSVYDLVDEVIIVDGGSTDKTVEIAKSYGKKVKVYIEDNPSMFHINKQKAIERARGEWILQLDADEELSRELKQEIVRWLNSYMVKKNNHSAIKPFGHVAFYIPRKNFFLTRFLMKGGQYPDYTIRLYRNGYARFPCKSVHENVEITSNLKSQISNPNLKTENLKNLKFQIGYLKNPILHYADPDFSRYLKRWDRYTSLEANKLLQEVKSPASPAGRQKSTRSTSSGVILSKVEGSKVKSLIMFIDYFILKPKVTFFLMYFRHLGFTDGFPGFVFALFSSIRFWVIYIKFWQIRVRAK